MTIETKNETTGPVPLPVDLSEAQIEEFGRELDAIRDEVMDSRGERDRQYILNLISSQRSLAFAGRLVMYASVLFRPEWGHAYANVQLFWALLGLGTLSLALGKIIENMEIGHNVLHGQWDWMKDENIQSNTWEWDHVCPSSQWLRSHNVKHHTWTNVVGKDPDVGYGLLRVTSKQRWKPFYLGQPLYALLLAILFEWGIAIQELELGKWFKGNMDMEKYGPRFRLTGQKIAAQTLKDYVLWPLFGVLLALPFALAGAGPSLVHVFVWICVANVVASILRSLWLFLIIFCGHFPADVYMFSKQQVAHETRGGWYLRQLLASCNIRGGKLFHIMSGNLSHQVEHHMFPDLPSNRYPDLSPRVRAIAARYNLPYNTGSLTRQFGTTVWKILRLSFPGGKSLDAA